MKRTLFILRIISDIIQFFAKYIYLFYTAITIAAMKNDLWHADLER
jgi:hypothetical protein